MEPEQQLVQNLTKSGLIHAAQELHPGLTLDSANAMNSLALSTGGGLSRSEVDSAPSLLNWGTAVTFSSVNNNHQPSKLFQTEGYQLIRCLNIFHEWVLEFPDNLDNNNFGTTNSFKQELLTVSFPLLVTTYLELLENKLEEEGFALLQKWHRLYLPFYKDELKELEICNSTTKVGELNELLSKHNDTFSDLRKLKGIRAQVIDKIKKCMADNNTNNAVNAEKERLLEDLNNKLTQTEGKMRDQATEATQTKNKLKPYTFLRQFKSLKWQLNLSVPVYSLLTAFLSQDLMLPLSAMLQAHCHLNVEQYRDPLSYVPASAFHHDFIKEKLKNPNYSGKDDTFNSSLLLNGFRRLAALEAKAEIDQVKKLRNATGNASMGLGDLCFGDPLSPSALLVTCGGSSSWNYDPSAITSKTKLISSDEQGITCTRLSPADGRKVAIGCEDSSVRIWSVDAAGSRHFNYNNKRSNSNNDNDTLVLYGHKNGYPVYGVDWCIDGKHLISCGGDGTIRLWNVSAVGPVGKKAKNTQVAKAQSGKGSLVEVKGAAIATYLGHALGSCVFDCKFAPTGYYFASCGSDKTVRIWTTDRIAPVRVLDGHLASVGCVCWHPNCNYVLSGSDDKTLRMWDVQTGTCVRIFTGSTSYITCISVDPAGKYVAAADGSGTVRIWELGKGRMLQIFRSTNGIASHDVSKQQGLIINSLAYSPCGTVLAIAGDNTIQLWDTKSIGHNRLNPEFCAKDVKDGGIAILTSLEALVQQGESVSSELLPSSSLSNASGYNNTLTESVSKTKNDNEDVMGSSNPNLVLTAKSNVSLLEIKYSKRNLLLCSGKVVDVSE